MDNKRTRRFLIVAFALSLLIHLILTGIIRWPFAQENDEVQVVRIEHLHATRIAHVVPPPHTPPPAPPRRVPVHVARATAINPNSTQGEGRIVTAATAPPASPAPAATATPNCAANDTPVQVTAAAPQPEMASGARADQKSGIARVRLVVDPQGGIESATVIESTGSTSLDQVAVTMARSAQYAPATHACKAVAADFTYAVKFYPW
jgi:periplasmic protein TonB